MKGQKEVYLPPIWRQVKYLLYGLIALCQEFQVKDTSKKVQGVPVLSCLKVGLSLGIGQGGPGIGSEGSCKAQITKGEVGESGLSPSQLIQESMIQA